MDQYREKVVNKWGEKSNHAGNRGNPRAAIERLPNQSNVQLPWPTIPLTDGRNASDFFVMHVVR